jgi:hypothetical protein
MRVHERYHGRRLRCTGCRAEFVADPTEAVDPAPETPVEPRAIPWRALALCLLLIGLAALVLWWLGGERDAGFGSSLFRATRGRTQIGVLRSADQETVLVALDRDTARRLARAAESRDSATLRELRASPNCLTIAAGSRVRVLERSKRKAEARVRILDGPQSGRIVWVPITWVR